MSKEEIISGNKLILLFMGGVVGSSTKYQTGEMTIHSVHLADNQINDFINHTKYHSSWDWLMPVVEKIDGLSTIESEELSIENLTIFAEKEMVWECVIQFIKWYNQQSK